MGSGIARLGLTGACALATKGHALPVQVCMQIISTDVSIVDRESGAKWLNDAVLLCISHRITSLVCSPFTILPYK